MKTFWIVCLLATAGTAWAVCAPEDVLETIRPGAQWAADGSDYSGLNWLDTTQTKPTRTEISDAVTQCRSDAIARRAAKVQARADVKDTTLTQAKRFQALLILLDFDR